MSRQLHLLPARALQRRATREAIAVWAKVLVVVATACGGLSGLEFWRGQIIQQDMDALEAQHAPIEQLRSDINDLRSKIAAVNESEQLALELASKQPMVTLVGQLGIAAAQAGGDLFIESLEYERVPAMGAKSPQQVLQLAGTALDHVSVTRFVEALQASKLFSEIELTATDSQMLAQQSVTSFSVECSF